MAMQLIREHELLTLKVSLSRARGGSTVQLELESNKGGSPQGLTEAVRLSTTELGLPRYLEPQGLPSCQLPERTLASWADALSGLNLPVRHPLWLYLVKPYGYLGVVPWEQLLAPVLARPILRLPDFLEPPRECRTVLDVALCCSVPLSEPDFQPPEVLHRLTRTILARSPRPETRVHVFADAEYFYELQQRFLGEPRIQVHDPKRSARSAESSDREARYSREVTCPWLTWIRRAMKGRPLDSVHFVCHGLLSDDRPGIAVADSPLRNRDQPSASMITVPEVAAFLTQTGAWSMACSAPQRNYSEAGLRLFVDSLAQERPGPAFFHDGGMDPWFTVFGDLCEFLYSSEPEAAPETGSGFLYCQPALVATQMLDAQSASSIRWDDVLSANAVFFEENETARAETSQSPNAPAWLAAAQRYVEGAAFESQLRDATDPSSRNALDTSTVEQTLRDAQEILGRYAQASRQAERPQDDTSAGGNPGAIEA